MGLDQAVIKMSQETYDLVKAWHAAGDDDAPYPDTSDNEYVWEGRKENHIQAFMEGEVGEVNNCDYLQLSKADVELLVHRLRRVDEDHSLADAELPTQAGFFFGGTDYDEWYFTDIKDELKAFSEILDTWDEDSVYVYWAWW